MLTPCEVYGRPHPGEKRIYLLRERCCHPPIPFQILREFDCMASFNNALLQLCPASSDTDANVSKVLVLRMWRSSFFSADFLSISICYPPLPIHLSGGTATSAARAMRPYARRGSIPPHSPRGSTLPAWHQTPPGEA